MITAIGGAHWSLLSELMLSFLDSSLIYEYNSSVRPVDGGYHQSYQQKGGDYHESAAKPPAPTGYIVGPTWGYIPRLYDERALSNYIRSLNRGIV